VAKYRLRPEEDFRSPGDERALYRRTYPDGYRHDRWADHIERIKASADLIERYGSRIRTAADLSCGDGALLNMISTTLKLDHAWFGDLNGVPASAAVSCRAPATILRPEPLPDSLHQLPVDAPVDLLILSETLEHVKDPDRILADAADWSRYLFLSTPLGERVGSGNTEHYWGWDQADLHRMLQDNGWDPLELKILRPEATKGWEDAYVFQLWMAVSL
jgi:hypothetical protein